MNHGDTESRWGTAMVFVKDLPGIIMDSAIYNCGTETSAVAAMAGPGMGLAQYFPLGSKTVRSACLAIRAWRVDHEVDYFVADAAVLQVDDFGCAQAIHRL